MLKFPYIIQLPCWHVLDMAIINTSSHSSHLTWRQKQCLRLVAEGMTVQSIALELGISVRTVDEHLHGARDRLGAVSTSQAIHLAMKKGLLR